MHKSKANGVDPTKIANVYGADILRLWTATIDYQQDVRIGDNIVKQVSEQYRKLRNTLKFISWNLTDFDPSKEAKEYELVDRFLLEKNQYVINFVKDKFSHYDFASGMSVLLTYMSSDLSSFYLDIAKDTLYCEAKNSVRRNQVQSVLYRVGETLLRLLNPVLPFTMDEFNKNLPGERKKNAQLYDLPESRELDNDLLAKYEDLLKVRGDVLKALEEARSKQIIGSSQQAEVNLEVKDSKVKDLFANISLDELAKIFVVSDVHLCPHADELDLENAKVYVAHHAGKFCERCWNYEYDAVEQSDGTYLCKRCHQVMEGK